MYIPIKLSSSIFLMLMVIPATLSSPVNIKHKMKDCGLSSCELAIDEPKEMPDNTNTLVNQILEEFKKQDSKKDKQLSYDSKFQHKIEGEGQNYKKESAAQVTKHEISHAESIIAKSSSYENSGESKKKLVEIKTNISHHEVNDGKPIVKNMYSYKILSGGNQQMKELETKFSKLEHISAIPAVDDKNIVNSAEIDENLLKLLPKFDNKNTVSDEKHVSSVTEDSHFYENSAESSRKVTELASKASQHDLSNANHISKDLNMYEKKDESKRKYQEAESTVSKQGLSVAHSKTSDGQSNINEEYIKLLIKSLSKNAEQNSVHGSKHEPKLPNQEETQVNSVLENSHVYENSAESNRKVTELASKASQHDLSNANHISKDLNMYEKKDESKRKYQEAESTVSKQGLSVAHSKTSDGQSNINEEYIKLLIKSLSKNAEQNSVHGSKHEPKLPNQEETQVNSVLENSHVYENSAESSRKVTELASKASQHDLSNANHISKDLNIYEKKDESKRKYQEAESTVSKQGLSVAHSKTNDGKSNINEEYIKLLIKSLAKNAEQNSVHGSKHEPKLPNQEETQVNSVLENSHVYENSAESSRKLTELASKASQHEVSNNNHISKDLNIYEKKDESKRKYQEAESTVSKQGLSIAHSKTNDGKSAINEEYIKLLIKLLSKNAEQNSVHGSKHEPKLPNQEETQVNSVLENSHVYENSAESSRKVTELASKASQHDLSNNNHISKDLNIYEKKDESKRKYQEAESTVSKQGLSIAHSKTNDGKSTINEEYIKLLIKLLSKNAEQNSVHGSKHEPKLPNQEETQVNSVLVNSHVYENSDESSRKVTELASKASQHDLSNNNHISKDLNIYEKKDESKRKYQEAESTVSKQGLSIAHSKANDGKSNINEEYIKLLIKLLSKNAEQNSVYGSKHEPKLPNQEETHVNSVLANSHVYENSDESSRKVTELASKASQHDLSNNNHINKDLSIYEKKDESKRKYQEAESTVSKQGLSIAHSKTNDGKSAINEEYIKLLIKLLSKNAEQNSVHGSEYEPKLPNQEETQVNSVLANSHVYKNSAESSRKVTELASKASQFDLFNDNHISKDWNIYEKKDESKRKYQEAESTVSKQGLSIAHSKANDGKSNINEEYIKLLIKLLSKNTEQNSFHANKQYEVKENSIQHNVEDVWGLIGGLLSNNNPAGTNNKLLQLATKISNKEFDSAVELIDDLIFQNIPDVIKQKLIGLKVKLLQNILADHNSKNNDAMSQIYTIEGDSSLKEQMKVIMANLLRKKLTDIKSESNAALSIDYPANNDNEVTYKFIKGSNLHPYGNDEISYDNPTEENTDYKKNISILHPYGNDEFILHPYGDRALY